MSWQLELPYPMGPPLSLNKKLNHYAEARIVKEIKSDVGWLALSAKLPKGLDKVHVELWWQPPTVRPRDTDNPTPTLKRVIDGLVKYGLVVDDDHTHVSSECCIAPVVPGHGRMWVTITEVDIHLPK